MDNDDKTPNDEEGYKEIRVKERGLTIARLRSDASQAREQGRLSNAEEAYRKILEFDPKDLEALRGLIVVLKRRGNDSEAEKQSAIFQALFPNSDIPETYPHTIIRPPFMQIDSKTKDVASTNLPAASVEQTGKQKDEKISPVTRYSYSQAALECLAIADTISTRLEEPLIYRRMLLVALFISKKDRTAAAFLSTLGITDMILLSYLADSFHQTPTRVNKIEELMGEAAAHLSEFDSGNNFIAHLSLGPILLDITSAAEALAREQNASAVEPFHLFTALMNSNRDDPGWISWLLGDEKAEWIVKSLSKGPEAITVEAVKNRAIEDGLFTPPAASSDAAAKDDLLGFEKSAKAMASIILKPDTVPPLVVGVYGPWGSGKSTYIKLIRKELDSQHEITQAGKGKKETSNLIAVEYDAWSYSDAPKLWAGLIAKISKRLDEDLGFYGRMKYLFQRHLRQFIAAILLGLIPIIIGLPVALFSDWKNLLSGNSWVQTLLGGAIGVLGPILAFVMQKQAVFKNVLSLAAKFDSSPASGVINSIQSEFSGALESWINQKTGADSKNEDIEARIRKNNLKIIVFIDELDRCPLERIVDILEAIKLFLAKEIFIVFLAVDTRVASEAIRLHYKDVSNPDLPREYLEKIVQLPMRVPTADRSSLESYLRKFMPNVENEDPASDKTDDTGVQTIPATSPINNSEPTKQKIEKSYGTGFSIGDPTISYITNMINKRQADTPRSEPQPKPELKSKFTKPRPVFSLPQLPDTKAELKAIERVSEQFLESNPRRIKRLLNTYRYIKLLAHTRKELVHSPAWQETMIAWLAFTMRWPLFMTEAVALAVSLEKPDTEFLLSAIGKIQTSVDRPDEDMVREYLMISDREIKKLWEIAGNFLIESAA